jgi:hypothetical protein
VGTEALAAVMVASRAGDQRFRRWFAKMPRAGVSPRAARAFLSAMVEADVRSILPLVQTLTLIVPTRSDGMATGAGSGRLRSTTSRPVCE